MSDNFEKDLKRLNELVEKLDSNNITIQDSIVSFKEAIELSKSCIEFLNKDKGDVQILSKEVDAIVNNVNS